MKSALGRERRGYFTEDRQFIEKQLRRFSGSAWKVRSILKSAADTDGYCWPSVDGIAAAGGLATSTVKQALKELQQLGYIRIEIHSRKGSVVRHGYRLTETEITPVEAMHRDEFHTGTETEITPVEAMHRDEFHTGTETEITPVEDENHPGDRDENHPQRNIREETPMKNNCAEANKVCSTPPKEIAGTMPLNTGKHFTIYVDQVEQWIDTYPAVDVQQKLKEIRAWCDSNPTRRKTERGILRFINSWLAREQDKGIRVNGASSANRAQDRVDGTRGAFRKAAERRGITGVDGFADRGAAVGRVQRSLGAWDRAAQRRRGQVVSSDNEMEIQSRTVAESIIDGKMPAAGA